MFKIDTKDNFRIFEISSEELTEKMSDKLKNALLESCENSPFNVILKLKEFDLLPEGFLHEIVKIQKSYLQSNHSFYLAPIPVSWIQKDVIFEAINSTPTLEEAIDMVMMEEMERDLLGPE